MKKFVSQKGQDRWIIQEVFKGKRDGYFVDLAASDGVKINNTVLLEKHFGWKGVCIEPNPGFFKRLKQNRKCDVVNHVIDGENDLTVSFRVDNGEGGGIVAEDTDNNYKYRAKPLKRAKILQLKTKTLEHVLDAVGAPSVIDYLSLDVEGSETRIMRVLPFNRYKFLAMTIERPTPELNELLFSHGYVFVKNSSYDSFYVHESIPTFDTIPKEAFVQLPAKDW